MEVMVTYMQSFSQTVTTNKPTPSFGLSVVTKNSQVKQKPRERECVWIVWVSSFARQQVMYKTAVMNQY